MWRFLLVGRDQEDRPALARAGHRARTCLGQAVLISGEAGIGKMALVETVGAQAKKEGFTGTMFRCSPYYTNSALYPMIEQIKRRLRWQAGDTPYTKLAKLEQILANYNWVAEDVVPLFAALLSLQLPAGAAILAKPDAQEREANAPWTHWLPGRWRKPSDGQYSTCGTTSTGRIRLHWSCLVCYERGCHGVSTHCADIPPAVYSAVAESVAQITPITLESS